ncbi:hypothetical protein THASP1DRAFT_23661 [Thamnocephalis sphaerospora]|uniref:Uncharacterized protein n=1 Tax=Thamnocephalis sphaerospora TaxID=78915 RepID=A0A4V1IWP9_9FUNG|nr:hypothetical protein THASP1DRAFT_23661 [Thamnocephalis sphaerospora]|eukprot:RKP08319.1 hypothetical protein THASP1DRAFT_23661 [Thamnocephalis sphaerospora]
MALATAAVCRGRTGHQRVRQLDPFDGSAAARGAAVAVVATRRELSLVQVSSLEHVHTRQPSLASLARWWSVRQRSSSFQTSAVCVGPLSVACACCHGGHDHRGGQAYRPDPTSASMAFHSTVDRRAHTYTSPSLPPTLCSPDVLPPKRTATVDDVLPYVASKQPTVQRRFSGRFTQLRGQVERRLSRSLRTQPGSPLSNRHPANEQQRDTVVSAPDMPQRRHSSALFRLPPSQLALGAPIADELEAAFSRLCTDTAEIQSENAHQNKADAIRHGHHVEVQGGDRGRLDATSATVAATPSSAADGALPLRLRLLSSSGSRSASARVRPATMYDGPHSDSPSMVVASDTAVLGAPQTQLRSTPLVRPTVRSLTWYDDSTTERPQETPATTPTAYRRPLRCSTLRPRLVTDNMPAVSGTPELAASMQLQGTAPSGGAITASPVDSTRPGSPARASLSLWRRGHAQNRANSISAASGTTLSMDTDGDSRQPRRSASVPSNVRGSFVHKSTDDTLADPVLETGLASFFRTQFELRFTRPRSEERQRRHQHATTLLDLLANEPAKAPPASAGLSTRSSNIGGSRPSTPSIASWLTGSPKGQGPEPATIRLTLTPSLIRGDDNDHDADEFDYGGNVGVAYAENDKHGDRWRTATGDAPPTAVIATTRTTARPRANSDSTIPNDSVLGIAEDAKTARDSVDHAHPQFDSVAYLAMRQVYIGDADDEA